MFFLLLSVCLAQDLPDGPGKDAVLEVCQDCHALDTITMENRTQAGWKKTIAKMGDRGAEGTDEQLDAILVYLTKNFGRIDVNKAMAEQIVSGLDFSLKEAEAIVEYRKKNGDFKDWRDLKKVIDGTKVEAKKDHIAVK